MYDFNRMAVLWNSKVDEEWRKPLGQRKKIFAKTTPLLKKYYKEWMTNANRSATHSSNIARVCIDGVTRPMRVSVGLKLVRDNLQEDAQMATLLSKRSTAQPEHIQRNSSVTPGEGDH